VLRFTRKELRESLRDRRTLFTLVLMPLLLYPLLAIGFQKFLPRDEQDGEIVYALGVSSEQEGMQINELLQMGSRALAAERRTRALEGHGESVKLFYGDDLIESLVHGGINLGLRRRSAAEHSPPNALEPLHEYEFLVLEGSARSEEARAYVQARFDALNRLYFQSRFSRAVGQPQPAQVGGVLVPVANPNRKEGSLLATLVPLILILMTITGAVYPAIDLTAGERERGTLEVLMAAPVPRVGLLAAKYLAVLTVALLTALANLGMMIATLLATGLGPLLFGPKGLTVGFVLGTLGLLLLFALFFAAVLLAVCSFARSFKEAQAYLIPVMLASIAPGMLALTPGLKLDGALAVTPLVNVALLGRDLFEGDATLAAAAVVVGSTLLYAAAALALAARLFGAEAVLYSDQTGWADLFRRPAELAERPGLTGALLCLALLFPALFLLQGTAAQQETLSIELRLFLMSVGGAALFAGAPLLATWGRARMTSAFALRPPSLLSVLGALLLGASLWPFETQWALWLRAMGVDRGAGLSAALRPLLESWRGQAVLFVSLAVIAPLVEEWFFRGYLYSALRTIWRPAATVVGSGLLFGLFHLLALDGLAWERLPATTALGLLLGWVRLRTGSVWPCMLLHMAHNGVLTLLTLHADWFAALESQAALAPWLAAGAAGVGVGGLLVWLRPAARTLQ
jgi:ABC-2 type transport system permease protein/sodium transport system permease protein